MARTVVTFSVRGGEIVTPGAGWVYVWRETDAGRCSVIYVGATALHPAARAEKHLRDPDPLVGRIRARYTESGGDVGQPLAVHAVEVDPACRRAVVKARVAWLADRAGLLSSRFCGDPPALPAEPLSDDEEACAHALVASLA